MSPITSLREDAAPSLAYPLELTMVRQQRMPPIPTTDMTVRYAFDPRRRRIRLEAGDPFSHQDAVAWIHKQAEDGRWTFDTLQDLRAVTWQPTSSEISEVADAVHRLVAQHGERGRVAIVVNEPSLLFGMLRSYTIQHDGMGAFTSIADAEAWLDSDDRDP